MCDYIKIKKFNPKDKAFSFCIDKSFCSKTKNGICSLDADISLIEACKEPRRRNSIAYCYNLSKNIYYTFKNDPIVLNEYSCGHIDFTNGQHRICIARKQNLIIPVEYCKIESYACSCCNCNKQLIDIDNYSPKDSKL